MSEPLDLTEAVEAGSRAAANMAGDWYCPKHADVPRRECPWCVAEVAVQAAAPIIARQVRIQIAGYIAGEKAGCLMGGGDGCPACRALNRIAARIARGDR